MTRRSETTVDLVGSPLGDRQITVTGTPGRNLYTVSLTPEGPVLERFRLMAEGAYLFVYIDTAALGLDESQSPVNEEKKQ